MSAVKRVLVIEQAGTFSDFFTWLDADRRQINLTGYTAKMQIRESQALDATLILELSTANGRIVLGGVTGTVAIEISDEDAALLTFTEGYYDLKLTPPDGKTFRIMEGPITLSKGTTVTP